MIQPDDVRHPKTTVEREALAKKASKAKPTKAHESKRALRSLSFIFPNRAFQRVAGKKKQKAVSRSRRKPLKSLRRETGKFR